MAAKDRTQSADDAPISSKAQDRFSRWPFAERIANVLAARTDSSSLVVGIYGPWGDGKTSVLNMMVEALHSNEDVICVPFNPWHFDDQGQLIRAFFDTLADAIGKKLTTAREEFGKFLQRYGGILSLASFSVAGGLAQVSPGTAASDLGEKLSAVELDELKDRVNKLLVDSGKRVIVFIDDIDRLDREEVHAILKLIKLSASFSNTSYVVSFDDEVVAASLGERYGSGEAQGGRQFLEKIIQVPLHLPDAEGVDLRIICFEGVDAVLSQNGVELTEDDAEAFVRYFTDGIMPRLRTPRQAKRYVNAIRFAVPLLKGEVHLGDLLLIEALRSTYPRLYLTVRDNLDVFTGVRLLRSYGDAAVVKEEAKGVVEAGLAGLTASEREGAIDLLKALFPRLNAIFGNTSYGSDWDKNWDAAKRITSGDYFRRYFQYSVPARDVPDSLVSEALRAAKAADSAAVDAFCETVSQRNAWGRCQTNCLLGSMSSMNRAGGSWRSQWPGTLRRSRTNAGRSRQSCPRQTGRRALSRPLSRGSQIRTSGWRRLLT
jgi:predicted KAP-like P-loop ATPase